METRTFKIDANKSNIEWTGKKVTGAHNGTIDIADGTLIFNDGQLTGGKLNIDTTSIKILDVTDPNTNAQFAGHLASDDFFSIDKFPRATLEITNVSKDSGSNWHVRGDLTIKGITHPIEFNTQVETTKSDVLRATSRLIIDRTKYDIKFRSGNFFKDLGDTLIYNDFTLDVQITATAA